MLSTLTHWQRLPYSAPPMLGISLNSCKTGSGRAAATRCWRGESLESKRPVLRSQAAMELQVDSIYSGFKGATNRVRGAVDV